LVELLGSSPIPRSFVASCVSFPLRPLPSAGVTQLHRYYEPLRHPTRPGSLVASPAALIATGVERTSSRAGIPPLWTSAFTARPVRAALIRHHLEVQLRNGKSSFLSVLTMVSVS
jgi:hypothetical protein